MSLYQFTIHHMINSNTFIHHFIHLNHILNPKKIYVYVNTKYPSLQTPFSCGIFILQT